MNAPWPLCCACVVAPVLHPLYQGSTPSWFGGSSFWLLWASLSAGKFRRGQSVGSAAAPGPVSVSRRALVRSHPLPKPLFFLNSLCPQPLCWQDLAACLVTQTFTPGSQPLAVPPHTLLRQQLLWGQRALASGSPGAPGGTQVDRRDGVHVSPSHCEEAPPALAGRGQIPRPVC